jgi:hypothetical protein
VEEQLALVTIIQAHQRLLEILQSSVAALQESVATLQEGRWLGFTMLGILS